jgi:hypothetical protein
MAARCSLMQGCVAHEILVIDARPRLQQPLYHPRPPRPGGEEQRGGTLAIYAVHRGVGAQEQLVQVEDEQRAERFSQQMLPEKGGLGSRAARLGSQMLPAGLEHVAGPLQRSVVEYAEQRGLVSRCRAERFS